MRPGDQRVKSTMYITKREVKVSVLEVLAVLFREASGRKVHFQNML
jgi:hypothetical protein